jgi:hypothetical protein
MSGVRAVARLGGAAVLLAVPLAAGLATGHAAAGAWPGDLVAATADGALLGTGGAPGDPAARAAVDPRPDAQRGTNRSSEYAFLLTRDDGSPVLWDPCRPVAVVVQADGAPDGGVDIVASALEDLSAATGLQLVMEGRTAEAPDPDRRAHQPDRYGDRWAPVLVAWADEATYPALRGDRVGVATPVAVDPAGPAPARYVTGSVVLEASWFDAAVATPEGRSDATGVLKHELGHLVGLDHVDDPLLLMSPVYHSLPDWSAGDRAGLAAAGAGPCLEPVPPS